MAGSFNTITLVGYAAREPESRFLNSGSQITEFSVATTERRKNQDDKTTWFKVKAFGKLAETCSQYLHKGSYVYVEGSLVQEEWTDREGNARTTLTVTANKMNMLDKVSQNHEGQQDQPAATPRQSTRPKSAQQDGGQGDDPLGDLPF